MTSQVVGCVVRSCDTNAYPPKLSLALDVAGKTEQMGDATAQEVSVDSQQLDYWGVLSLFFCSRTEWQRRSDRINRQYVIMLYLVIHMSAVKALTLA